MTHFITEESTIKTLAAAGAGAAIGSTLMRHSAGDSPSDTIMIINSDDDPLIGLPDSSTNYSDTHLTDMDFPADDSLMISDLLTNDIMDDVDLFELV